MRILVVGGTGTIGSAVVDALRNEHEVLAASRSSADLPVDITSPDSIGELFRRAGRVDAVISCTGRGGWGPLEKLTDEDFELGLFNKLMGQVNLVRLGIPFVADGGSFTLSSGVLSQEPAPGSAVVSLVNSGVEGFARAAALELPRGIRINVVSPPWVSETLTAMGQDPSMGLPAATVAKAYVDSATSELGGQVIDARRYS
jgi:NAD(P)-dependent dehydrogenase (short-subunit alcohol dehydrogenase family)